MIDLRLLRENPDKFRASQRARGDAESSVDRLLSADEARRSAVQRFEALRAEQKSMGKQVASAKGEDKTALLARSKDLSAQVKSADAESQAAEEELRQAQLAL